MPDTRVKRLSSLQGRPSPPETMMHFPPCFRFPPYFPCFSTFPPVSRKLFFPPTLTNSPLFYTNSPAFYILYVYFSPPTLTMMHLCITQCTYWTPLVPWCHP